MENSFEKVLVCVEDVNLDAHVIAYTHMIAKTVGLKSVYLLHVIHDTPYERELTRNSEIEGMSTLDVDQKYHDEIQRLTSGYTAAMADAARVHFGDLQGIEQHVDVRVGNQLKDTLMVAHEKDIDLIVMGRHLGARLEKGDVALLPRRIARKSTCSVLVIPEEFTPKLTNILCPVRLSKCSVLALQTAIDLGSAFNARIHAINLFHVFNEVHYPGGAPDPVMPLEEKLKIGHALAEKENNTLEKQIHIQNVPVEFESLPDLDFQPADTFEALAEKKACDLVVMGARGRTGAAGVLLGTITEQLIRQCKVPLLATKKKGEHIGVLHALLTLFGKD